MTDEKSLSSKGLKKIMLFQIEKILSIKNKSYLLTKSLSINIRFKLSDNSFLGDFEIENWFDIPQARDSNGNLRTDKFIFVLKDETDKEQIRQGEILRLLNLCVIVVESNYTVSGKVISVLECGAGMLDINTVLIDKEKKWRVVENDILLGRQNDVEFQNSLSNNFWFTYNLEPIGHSERPEAGRSLQIIRNSN